MIVWLLLIISLCKLATADEVSPETLFRQTIEAWQMSGRKDYKPFDQLADALLRRFAAEAVADNSDAVSSSPDLRLPIVGAMEESILVLERFIFEQDQGREELVRDRTMSHLYLVYATALSQLKDVECKALASDPHTLLIGADTVTASSPPSTHLCVQNAENSARNAAALDATNTRTEALLEDLLPSGEGGVHERKPKEFVAELFDSFADTFDEKLLHGLEYKVPQMVGEMARKMLSSPESKPYFRDALDAGCGTGLAGRHLRPLVRKQLVGVDASSKMLDVAKACTLHKGCGLEEDADGNDKPSESDRPLYDDLMVLDLEEMTLENTLYRHGHGAKAPEGFDLIVAADVFVYFGSLKAVLGTFARVSRAGAALIFTCERAMPREAPLGWRLLPSGRFAHTKEHVVGMAREAGYRLEAHRDIVPRMEKGEPVKGHLFGFVLEEERGSNEDGDEL